MHYINRPLAAIMSVGNHAPPRALLISLAALAIPVAGAFWVPGALQDYEALSWMLAVVPAFLLAYYKAWRGAAVALASAMAVVSVTYAVTQALGRPMPDLILAVVVIMIAVSLGIGALAERLHRGGPPESPTTGFTDLVTGLPNRAHAELHLEMEFGNAERGPALTVVLLDVDNLKGYNARHGDIAGDEVLRLVADVLRRITRRSNLCARYAEDEFLCVLGGANPDGAIAFVHRFHQSLHESAGQRQLPAISGGIAGVTPSMKTHSDLVAAARTALHRAKKEGRGRLRVHGRALDVPLVLGEKPAAAAAPAVETKDARSIMPEGRGRGRKALIVAEQQPVRALLARYLNDHGFSVTQASNIVDGVQSLAVEYDLLFTDISLHEGIGTELVRAAKLRWPAMQIIGLVQNTEGNVQIETLNSGVDRYLITPLDLPKVRQHITELLARRDRQISFTLESRQLTAEFQARTNDAVTALRQTEEEYRAVVHTLHEVIFRTDVHGVFTFLNDAWEEVTGHKTVASIGRAAVDFVQQDDRAEFETALQGILNNELDNVRAEVRMTSANGNVHWLELRARRAYDADSNLIGVSGTLEDVTTRKEAQEALRRSEAASRGLLAALPDEVLLLSRAGMVLGHEGAAAGGGQTGASVEQVFPAAVAQDVRALLAREYASNEVQVLEYEVPTGDRTTEFEVRVAASSEDTLVAIVRNITDRKALEEQLRQSQKLEAIGRLAGGLAHDFNNLLTVVQGNAHLLADEVANETARDYVQQIAVAAERGATLVRQLLAFGRRQVLQPTVLNINSLVEDTRSTLARLIGEQIQLAVDLDPEVGLIKADAGQIEQVLVNLAMNARDVMSDGGVLRISTRNAALALHGTEGEGQPDDVVLLCVSDNGPGMDAETLARVFEPFFTTKGRAQASGLGLATVYGIVRQSGGTISVLSEPGQGTNFEIALPRING